MSEKDPIIHVERMVREVHDRTERLAQPVLSRYPLLFSFLTVFSVAAILHGFDMIMDEIVFFKQNPSVLVLAGTLCLFFTGALYKSLEKLK